MCVDNLQYFWETMLKTMCFHKSPVPLGLLLNLQRFYLAGFKLKPMESLMPDFNSPIDPAGDAEGGSDLILCLC